MVVLDEVQRYLRKLPDAVLDDAIDIATGTGACADDRAQLFEVSKVEDATVDGTTAVLQTGTALRTGLTRKAGTPGVCRWPRGDFFEGSELGHENSREHRAFQPKALGKPKGVARQYDARVMRPSSRILALFGLTLLACGPIKPSGESVTAGRSGETRVTVTRTDPSEMSAPGVPATESVGVAQMIPAKPLEPPAKAIVGPAVPLLGAQGTDGPLPLPTALATTKSALFAFGRTRAGWIVRTQLTKGKGAGLTWSSPAVVAPAFDDDAQPVAIADGELAWFGVSSKTSGTRIARIDVVAASAKVTPIGSVPLKLGNLGALVVLKGHIVAIGRDADAITFARLDRGKGFLDPAAKVIARGTATMSGTPSRSPRATTEDDRVLLAWDSDEVSGALETPGTTPAERAAPKSGVYVRRFSGSGDPLSPARRLTRPSFEAHALDVVVELGACAVLASTTEGFEMFRFVRKGSDLNPYGGGLHLATAGGDVALGADVIGTIGVTSSKLLRIGPGVKIVPSPLGLPGTFDETRIAMDGYGAHVLVATRTPLGPLPTIARIDGEHMGPTIPTPWIGPPPQRLLLGALDGDEALAIVLDGGALHTVRMSSTGESRGTAVLPLDAKNASVLEWPRSPAPRAARAAGEWVLTLRDGRVFLATGPRAGTFLIAKNAFVGGTLALMPTANKSGVARIVSVPPPDRSTSLWTATVDPKAGTISALTSVADTEHYYGALGAARYMALPGFGGLVLLTSSGPKVSAVAQLYGLIGVDPDGHAGDLSINQPAPIQELSLVPSLGGTAIVATITGKGVATRWLEGAVRGWREGFAFSPYRLRGDGPIARDKGIPTLLTAGALPIDVGAEAAVYLGDRCPFVLPTSERSLLLMCEEGSGDTPLAARATARVLRL